MTHLGLQVAYRGSDFFGFQRQPEHESVQENLEVALETLFKQKIRIRFSSRTDRGVHALDQMALVPNGFELFERSKKNEPSLFRYALNSLLPPSIRVIRLYQMSSNFRPKEDVLKKEYWYLILNSPVAHPLHQDYWQIYKPLSVQKMRDQAKYLIGRHDFRSFSKTSKKIDQTQKGYTREIKSLRILVERDELIPEARWITLKVSADGFLHHMVRTIAGSLVAVGQGQDYDFKKILERRSRVHAGYRAPAEALTLRRTVFRRGVRKLLI